MIKRLILVASLILSSVAYAAPRGIENHNPGNLIKTTIPWKGKIECKDKQFECFNSNESGIRAMFKTLIKYKVSYHVDTVEGIVNRWTSGDGTRIQINYINYVASSCNLNKNAALPNYGVLVCVINSMISFENGYNPLRSEVINHAFRNGHYAREYGFRWSAQTLVSIPRGKEARENARTSPPSQTDRRRTERSKLQEQTSTVHSPTYSPNSSILYYPPTQVSYPAWGRRNIWLDRA